MTVSPMGNSRSSTCHENGWHQKVVTRERRVGRIHLQTHREGQKRGRDRPFGRKVFCSRDLHDIRLHPAFMWQRTRLSCNERSSTPAKAIVIVGDQRAYPGDARHGGNKHSGRGPTAWFGAHVLMEGGLNTLKHNDISGFFVTVWYVCHILFLRHHVCRCYGILHFRPDPVLPQPSSCAERSYRGEGAFHSLLATRAPCDTIDIGLFPAGKPQMTMHLNFGVEPVLLGEEEAGSAGFGARMEHFQ